MILLGLIGLSIFGYIMYKLGVVCGKVEHCEKCVFMKSYKDE